MKSFFAPIAVVAALASAVSVQAAFTINTPLNVVVCQPALLNWVEGQAPYFLSILPAGQPSAAALVDLGQQTGNSVTWLANLGVGTSAFLNLRDNTGAIAQSGNFIILSGTNTTCVGQAVSTSAGPAAATTSGSSNTSPAATTPAGSTTTGNTVTTGSKTAATTTGSNTAKPTSGAISKNAAAGAAVMIGSAILGLAL
ncbi:hypothetical protein BDN70DRAFT_899120 [Pholiota conissans]|uniref:Uncharacterized protein n=1 Tax=Pholiota conissans TaxID=109636 RepID=A0A9P5YT50_9AGAR|nr:hypothetical protein BDN70DRAFT_899120 [Pholiota conissans]